ncbi:MAG: HU family DNA-binding protein [Prevotella sp.]|nr:HU family DNA-binding protein [Prevotella sp.]
MAKIQDLAKYLSAKHKIQQKEAERFLTAVVDVLNDGLHYEKLVKVKGLGTFKVIDVKNRESVDVNTGERILIEGRPKITFTPDAVMKDLVNKPFAQFETVVLNEGVTFDNLPEESEVPLADEPEPQPEIEQLMEEKPAPEPVAEDEQPEEIIIPQETESEPVAPLAEMPVAEVPEPETPEETPVEEVALPESHEAPQGEPETPETPATPETQENLENLENLDDLENLGKLGNLEKLEKPEKPEEPASPAPQEPLEAAPKSSKSWIGWLLGMVAVGAAMYFLGYHNGRQAVGIVEDSQVIAEGTTQAEAPQAPVDTIAQAAEAEKAAAQAEAAKAKADSIAQAEAYAKAEAAKKAAYEAEVKKQQEEALAQEKAADSKTLNNARNIVRTGAYNIVGTQQSVIVRKGQTLEKLSKMYLGPGMEVYVMVHNGVTEAKEGSTLKIPKLQVKKKR